MPYTIGIDYGTNSVRALVVDCANGAELGTCVVPYPSGHQGVLLDKSDPHLARQNPADHLLGLEKSVLGALELAARDPGFARAAVIGIGVDTTASSPIPVDAANRPLALDPQWAGNLNAQCWLWKDHTSHREALEITRIAKEHRPQILAKCGGAYSSEWFWSKIWHCLNVAPEVFDAAYSWVELADFIPAVLAGVTDPRKVVRGVCAAGHKGMYIAGIGAPDPEFLSLLDPRMGLLPERIYDPAKVSLMQETAHDANTSAGGLSAEWAAKLGLPAAIPITMGGIDVHYGAIGSGIEEGVLVKAIGTSTCDCVVVKGDKQLPDIQGICGIVLGSILPGYYGIEAGQSAVGDIFKWWVEGICEGGDETYTQLAREAAALRPGESGLLALDWNNGNRSVLTDPMLTGLLVGQTLYTTRAEIYRALIEATAFGARVIIERLREYGVDLARVVCCGGIAEKNTLLMQIYADVTGCTMQVAGSSQAAALGSAVIAAVLAGKEAGGYETFPEAQAAMTSLKKVEYRPNPDNQSRYDALYRLYLQAHDAFGGVSKSLDLSRLMKELIALRKD